MQCMGIISVVAGEGPDLINRANQSETIPKALMGVTSSHDLLTMLKLKNTAAHFHNDEHNLPRAAQITNNSA